MISIRYALPVLLACTALTVEAGNGKGKGNYYDQRPLHAAPCPPGLAKKNPPCIPPGQAKKYPYRVGDRIIGDYVIIRDPRRYRLDPRHTYYRVGDYVYRVDRETKKVLDFIGAAAALLY